MPGNILTVTYQIQINFGKTMKKIPNHMVTELQRLVPLIIDNVSDTKNTRVLNAIRITKKIIKKLDNLKDIEK
nr:MAG TPA: hypothetical protein [Caudoviricetes sp.]